MPGGRTVRLARLPAMRLAFFERTLPVADAEDGFEAMQSELWEAFSTWRVEVRPALGRPDIAAILWTLPPDEAGMLRVRAAVPVRGDYKAPPPATTVFFPGGALAYAYADDTDEYEDAFGHVAAWIEAEGYRTREGAVEVHKFHYNLDQHPADCGFLVEHADGRDVFLPEQGGHGSPLPIARRDG